MGLQQLDFVFTKKNISMLDNTQDKPFKCDKCHYTTNRSFDLRRHQQRHSRVKPVEGTLFQCNECEFVTKWKRNMGRHMEKHKRRAKQIAEDEAETEAKQEDLSIEEFIVELIDASQVKQDEEAVASDDLESVEIVMAQEEETQEEPLRKPQKRFKCDLCRYTSNRAFDLRRHTQTHYRVKVVDGMAFKCSECNFITKWKRNMRRHMRKHEDPEEEQTYQKPDEEETCQEPNRDVRDLEDNDLSSDDVMVELINTEIFNSDEEIEIEVQAPSECSEAQEKRHKCGQCEYESKRAYDLRRHEQIHAKIKPLKGIAYQCNNCSFITMWKRNMRRHMEKHKPKGISRSPDDEFVVELKSDVNIESAKTIDVEEDSEVLPSYWIALPSETA